MFEFEDSVDASAALTNCPYVCPADGDAGVVGYSRRVVRRSPLGHHPGHTAGVAGAGHVDVSYVEGTQTHTSPGIPCGSLFMRYDTNGLMRLPSVWFL